MLTSETERRKIEEFMQSQHQVAEFLVALLHTIGAKAPCISLRCEVERESYAFHDLLLRISSQFESGTGTKVAFLWNYCGRLRDHLAKILHLGLSTFNTG